VEVILKGSLRYGNRDIGVDIRLDVGGAVSLVGPNLTGKSLTLWCIYAHAAKKIGRAVERELPNLECRVDSADYYAVYVDAYRVAVQLYELSVKPRLEDIVRLGAEMRDLASSTAGATEIADIDSRFIRLRDLVKEIQGAVYGDFEIALSARQRADDWKIAEAQAIVDEVRRTMEKAREDPELKDLIDEYMPLLISVTSEGFVWRDPKIGAEGAGLRQLSTVFAPALVLAEAIYAYGLPRQTFLLVEEPEAHAHPVLAFFLGRVLRRLVERSGGRFNVVAATHSLDFLAGIGPPAYIFARDAERIYVKGIWRGEGRVPGFTDAAIYRALV
jgi:hypothetical protein